MEGFAACLAELKDPRGSNALHDLREIVFIALLATLCGATSCCDMVLFARLKEALLRSVLKLKHGLPSHDTFSRAFRMLDPKGFKQAFQRSMQVFCAHLKLARPTGVIALDGKALRGAYERGKRHLPALMVSAWGAQTRMALANMWAQDGNEAAAVRSLIELLQLKDCMVTADALHCRRDMAAAAAPTRATMSWRSRPTSPSSCGPPSGRLPPRAELPHGRQESRVAFVASAATAAELDSLASRPLAYSAASAPQTRPSRAITA